MYTAHATCSTELRSHVFARSIPHQHHNAPKPQGYAVGVNRRLRRASRPWGYSAFCSFVASVRDREPEASGDGQGLRALRINNCCLEAVCWKAALLLKVVQLTSSTSRSSRRGGWHSERQDLEMDVCMRKFSQTQHESTVTPIEHARMWQASVDLT